MILRCVSRVSIRLEEKIRRLDEQLLKHRETIRRTRPGPAQEAAKRRALTVLKQKRLYENQRTQLYDQQFSVDSAAHTMASMQDNVQVMQAMQAGATQMKKMMKTHKELDVDQVWKTMDTMQDLQADFEEIQEAMASFSAPVDLDEDDLLDELDALGEDAFEDLNAEGVAEGDGAPAYLQEPLGDASLPEAPGATNGGGRLYPVTEGGGHAEGELHLPEVPERS